MRDHNRAVFYILPEIAVANDFIQAQATRLREGAINDKKISAVAS